MKTLSSAGTLLGLLFLCLLAACSGNGDGAFVIDQPMETPEWAQLQRELMAANAEGAQVFTGKFFDERGYLLCIERWGGNDGPDDAMENLNNWTLAYALGAPESVADLYSMVW